MTYFPNFIFIDIDRCLFTTDNEFRGAVKQTRKSIDQTLGGKPTVLWSGNGVHIYQSVEAIVFEQESLQFAFDFAGY